MKSPFISLHLVDLDELLLHCRDEAAQALMQEAVSSYHAGAFRSAIISSWIAVFVDLAGKIRSLSLAGDQRAQKWIVDFDRLAADYDPQQQNTITPFQKLESQIINVARDSFELISPLESGDLRRLRSDRHRSAHPAMRTPSELFSPTAELARSHIRNAIEIVLARPAIRGEAAVRRILATVRDEGFPTEAAEMKEILKELDVRQLAASSISLLLEGLLQDIFDPENSRSARRSRLTVIASLRDIFPDQIDSQFAILVSKHLENNEMFSWDAYVSMISYEPWIEHISTTLQKSKLKQFIRTIDKEDANTWPFIARCLRIETTRKIALSQVEELPITFLRIHRKLIPEEVLIEEATNRLSHADSWSSTYDITTALIIPNVEALTADQIESIKASISRRSDVNGSVSMSELIKNLLLLNDPSKLGTKDSWARVIDSCKNLNPSEVQNLKDYLENAYSDDPVPF